MTEEKSDKWPLVAGWRGAQLSLALQRAVWLQEDLKRMFNDEDTQMSERRKSFLCKEIDELVSTLRYATDMPLDEIYQFCLSISKGPVKMA